MASLGFPNGSGATAIAAPRALMVALPRGLTVALPRGSKRGLAFALLLAAVLVLAGCESSEERAERHYRSGLALLEQGETSQALVELRNVFKYDIRHREGRATYARVQRAAGDLADAYGQYLRLVEQYPDTLEARIALTEMALDAGNWDEAELHGRAAQALAPADPQVQLLNTALDYRVAVLAKDTAATAAAATAMRARLDADPASLIARRVTLDYLVGIGDAAAALEVAQAGIAVAPEAYEFHATRLRLLAEKGDEDAVGTALQDMATRFPADDKVRSLLVAWYLERGDMAGAEALLRRIADAPDAGVEAKLTVVEFLRGTQGPEAAMAELDRLIAAAQAVPPDAGPEATPATPVAPDAPDVAAGPGTGSGDDGLGVFRAMRATLDFEAGRSAEAVAAMRALLADRGAGAPQVPVAADGAVADGVPAGQPPAGSGPAVAETHNFRIMLARMLLATGDAAGARAEVDAVLAGDASQVDALKMRAAWLIDDDKPSDAILALRAALAQAPRDAAVLTLMGQAHERDGARGLAGERYALAVEVSGRAAMESLRYADFLLTDDRTDAAAAVLTEALAVAPQNPDLLQAAANVQMRRRDWDRAAQTVAALRALGTPAAESIANGLAAELLLRQERLGDTIAFLQGLVGSGDDATAALAALVQAQVQDGRIAEARALLDDRLKTTPQDPALRFLRAGLHVLDGETAPAEALYRGLVTEFPQSDRPLRVLYGLLEGDGRSAEATALVDAALAATPDAPAVRMLQAEDLERQRDFDAAIAVYEALYAENSADPVVANNLASLIATHRGDPASLERAFAVARRLKGRGVPAFQDTTGWIEYRRGNFAAALADLEPAAAGLPGDPLVQFHLGMTYAALNRPADARAALDRALNIAADSPLPQFAQAREVLAGLPAE